MLGGGGGGGLEARQLRPLGGTWPSAPVGRALLEGSGVEGGSGTERAKSLCTKKKPNQYFLLYISLFSHYPGPRWGGVRTPPPPCVTFRRVVVPLRGPGQSRVLPFACCVGSLRSVGHCGRCSCWCHFRVRGAQSLVCRGCAECAPLCDIPSGCCSFTGPWTVTRSSLRMLRRVATVCRPLRPVLLLASFPRSRSPVVGVLGLC